jgi:hypothetical protein
MDASGGPLADSGIECTMPARFSTLLLISPAPLYVTVPAVVAAPKLIVPVGAYVAVGPRFRYSRRLELHWQLPKAAQLESPIHPLPRANSPRRTVTSPPYFQRRYATGLRWAAT